MRKLAELIIKLLSALSHVVESAADLYHAIRVGLTALISTIKEQMKERHSKNK